MDSNTTLDVATVALGRCCQTSPPSGGAPSGVYANVLAIGQSRGMAFDTATTGITRRALVKSAAWSAPVVALAVAAPGAAASVTPITVNADLNFLYGDAQNTWMNLIRGGSVLQIYGTSANTPVSSVVATFEFSPTGFSITDWQDSTGDGSGWALTSPFKNGSVEFTWVGVPLVPYNKVPYVGFGFNVSAGALPTSFSAMATSAQANPTSTTFPIRPQG